MFIFLVLTQFFTPAPVDLACADSYPNTSEKPQQHILKARSSFQSVPRCPVELWQLKVVFGLSSVSSEKWSKWNLTIKKTTCLLWLSWPGSRVWHCWVVIEAETGSSCYNIAFVKTRRWDAGSSHAPSSKPRLAAKASHTHTLAPTHTHTEQHVPEPCRESLTLLMAASSPQAFQGLLCNHLQPHTVKKSTCVHARLQGVHIIYSGAHTPLGQMRDIICIIYWNYRGQNKLRMSKHWLGGEREAEEWK